MSDGRVDCVFGNISLYTVVVITTSCIFRQFASFILHFACSLPCTSYYFADTAHSLGVGTHHAEYAHVVQHVLCPDCFRTDSGVCESNVFRNALVQMMAYHQHIQVLVQCVHCERHSWVCGRWQYIRSGSRFDDVRSMSAACTFCMISVDSSSCESFQCVFNASAFVQCICMDRNLHIIFISCIQAVIDSCRCGTPVFVDLQTHCACFDLFDQWSFVGAVTFAQESQVHWEFLCCFQHFFDVPWSRCASCSISTVCRSCPSADHCCYTAEQCSFDLVRVDIVDMSIDTACCNDHAFCSDCFSGCAYSHSRSNAVHKIRVSCLADADDFTVFHTDVSLYDTCIVNDQSVCDNQIQVTVAAASLYGLAHAVTQSFAAAEFRFIAVISVVFFYFYNQACVSQSYFVPCSGTVHCSVFAAGNFITHLQSLLISVLQYRLLRI